MKTYVAVYSSLDEIIVLPMSENGPVGKEEWFEEGARSYDDYDLEIQELPLHIQPRLSVN